MMKIGYICFSIILFFQNHFCFGANIPLSKNEKICLTYFFSVYFLEDDFSYTLFGQKPMSFHGYGQENEIAEILYLPIPKFTTPSIWNSYLILKKYRSLLDSDKFYFIFNEYKNHKGFNFFFINRDAFLKTVNENKDLFIKELGVDFDAEKFLQMICEEKYPLLDLIHHSDLFCLESY